MSAHGTRTLFFNSPASFAATGREKKIHFFLSFWHCSAVARPLATVTRQWPRRIELVELHRFVSHTNPLTPLPAEIPCKKCKKCKKCKTLVRHFDVYQKDTIWFFCDATEGFAYGLSNKKKSEALASRQVPQTKPVN